ncbi:MAG: tRNA threonylcarbamoyladenosine dehydratase [Ruminococcaceae bacterium]|nr:tRNA threonylcarbamoyladenosine dehydratase [Oscillospiraceae bacterium]
MENWLDRERSLIGEAAVERLKKSSVLIFGIGGVGGYSAEALARAGVGELTLVDHDTVNLTNLNRQIIALNSTLGMLKTEAAAERIADINPECRVNSVSEFADAGNIADIIDKAKPDYIIDAIDCVTSKLLIAEYANKQNIPLISSMGTGNKLDPEKLKIADISKTHTCPLARVMRRELSQRGIKHLTVLFSEEQPVKVGMRTPASISFVPSSAGLMIAGYCIRKIIEV